MGIVQQMAKTVIAYAEENNVKKIEAIVLQIGELSLVVPEYVNQLYPIVVKGTILEDTELEIEFIKGMAECDDCDEIFNVVENKGYCPNCGSFNKSILVGKDFFIKEIHVPEE